MPIPTALMTVEELRRLPEPTDGTVYELHYGELVKIRIPNFRHCICANNVAEELRPQLDGRGIVFVACAFRTLPECDARRTDVGFLSRDRLRKARRVNEIFGAPDLVVEVLSAWDTTAEMDDREAFYFDNGCAEFWLVDPIQWTVRVTRASKEVLWHRAGESIPLNTFGGGAAVVDRIFRDWRF